MDRVDIYPEECKDIILTKRNEDSLTIRGSLLRPKSRSSGDNVD